ncbi:MAG: type II secretion system protein [Phycisphaerae bacterium]|jgi:prepilin-type N-terminal cleavage/methylation domain-containing protein
MKNNIKKPAFTLIELMMSISILAIIMVAVGIALNASVMNYEANRDISEAVIKANQAISRITADLRCARDVQTTEPNNQCSMHTSDGSDITYSFDSSQRKLYLIKGGTSYVLCDNIGSAVFDREVSGGKVKSVQIILTVTVGTFTQNACAAVVIRKNM